MHLSFPSSSSLFAAQCLVLSSLVPQTDPHEQTVRLSSPCGSTSFSRLTKQKPHLLQCLRKCILARHLLSLRGAPSIADRWARFVKFRAVVQLLHNLASPAQKAALKLSPHKSDNAPRFNNLEFNNTKSFTHSLFLPSPFRTLRSFLSLLPNFTLRSSARV